jgi:hypothetical protein
MIYPPPSPSGPPPLRRIAVMLTGLVALVATACGPDGSAGPDDLGAGDIVGGNEITPPCPFTAEQVSDFLDLPMKQDAACSWRGDNAFTLASVVPGTRTDGLVLYDGARDRAGKTYRELRDIDRGEKGYVAYSEIGGQLFVVTSATSYVITLDGVPQIESDPTQYRSLLLKMFDAIGA